MDNYQILGVKPDASQEEIDKSLKNLRRKYHPDNNKENEQEALKKFQEVEVAYNKIMEDRKKQASALYQQSSDFQNKDYKEQLNKYKAKESEIENRKKKKETELKEEKSNFNIEKIKQTRYRTNLRIYLYDLLTAINNYYSEEIMNNVNSLLSAFKKEAKRKLEEEEKEIITVLTAVSEQIEKIIKEDQNDDSILFTISFKEGCVNNIKKIASKEFGVFLTSLQDYKKQHSQIVDSLESNLIKQQQLEKEIEELTQLLEKVQEKIKQLKAMNDFAYNFNPFEDFQYESGKRAQ